MFPLIFALSSNAYTNTCVFGGSVNSAGGLNTGGWVQINLLVVLASFMISAVIFSLANIFPVSMREKMKGGARYEIMQGIVSILIIAVLMGISMSTCTVGEDLVASSAPITHFIYQDPIQYSMLYIGNLMFGSAPGSTTPYNAAPGSGLTTGGLGLFSQIYSETVLVVISANLMDTIEEVFNAVLGSLLHVELGQQLLGVYYGMSGALSGAFVPLIVVTFGVLFVIFILLSLIESTALTVIVPVAIIMRSIPFAGPKLRESADSFLALAIGFYFILPLCILMNQYIIAWIYAPCTAPGNVCNPFYQYTYQYDLGTSPENYLFNTNVKYLSSGTGGLLGGLSVSNAYFSGAISGVGGLMNGLQLMFYTMINLPSIVVHYGIATAEYIFEGIVLIGLDLAITLGFAQGLTRGLNSFGRYLSVGPFWSNI